MAPRGGGPSRYSGKRIADPVTSPPMSSLEPDQAPSLSELPTPVTPDSIAVNISAHLLLWQLKHLEMTLYQQLRQIQLIAPAFELKSSWDVWSRVTMYPWRSQKSLRKNWILKDMIGSQLHQRLRISTGRSLRSDSIGILQLKLP